MITFFDWRKPLAITATLSLTLTAYPAGSTIPTSLQHSNKYQLVQAPDNCRRVETNGDNLNIRSSPDGEIIGTLRNYSLVIIENSNSSGTWIPISSPQSGYVSATYLKPCGQPIPPSQTTSQTDNCRKIFVGGVLRVRQAPSINSPILGVLQSGQQVTIKNRGKDGWVPISSPVSGYIPSIVLSSCT
ncbi:MULTISPECIES: SH3 domain-containing protein [Nostoc]|uniref:SH3 domain-containing protein n=2 Tax=Nostoc TaxID=1177 RepID=A0ABR8IGI2_9NOSO|nr:MULTISPECIES: SH3 domain-containing protein [Nostoc]MBD2565055.1 SH3 domain-containing protein [Nostoc linckia FACHB-391]MBD2650573.1 SH3 domain-containing protein [Nostoc foliaceum FACHB-393]